MKNLASIRKSKNITQSHLAEMVACNQATISKIEKGTANPTLALTERIAAVLDVSPAELFGMSDLEQRFMAAFRSASPEKQRAVLLLLEGDAGTHTM